MKSVFCDHNIFAICELASQSEKKNEDFFVKMKVEKLRKN